MTTEQTELIEKLNSLEFETSQLNHAYQQWRSYAEQGTVPEWMAVAARITYDALITFCLDTISGLAPDTSRTGETDRGPRTAPVLRGLGWPECYARAVGTAHALPAGDTMTALCVGNGRRLQCDGEDSDPPVRSTVLVDGSLALTAVNQQDPMKEQLATEQAELIEKLNCLVLETSQLHHAYQQWRSYIEQGTVPDWMAAATRITYDALMTFYLDTASPPASDTSHDEEIEYYALRETAPPPEPALLAEQSMTTLCLRHGQHLQYEHAQTDPPVYFTALVDGSLALTPVRRQNRIADVLSRTEPAFSVRHLAQLAAGACEIPGIVEEQTTAEPPPELLPMTEPDWSDAEMTVVISPPSRRDTTSGQPAIQQHQQKEMAEDELVAIPIPTTLAKWLQRSSSRLRRGAAVAILMVAGAAIGIYVASTRGAATSSDVRLADAGAVAIPMSEKAGFKFDPDPVFARPGSSFVLNAVLTRGSDIASVGAEIDYDANLLQFAGASQGGLLAKDQKFVLAQRNDPLTGVVKISAEQPPGIPGISGAGPVFALSFQARKKGNATVSIIPGAHDSQGRRIEAAGSQVSVTVH